MPSPRLAVFQGRLCRRASGYERQRATSTEQLPLGRTRQPRLPMQIFASGEGRKLNAPDEFLPQGSVGKVVGLIDLGKNNGSNDFGCSGVKTVIDFEGDSYVLDFLEHTCFVTDDGLELVQTDAGDVGSWWPDSGDMQRYGLRWIELAN